MKMPKQQYLQKIFPVGKLPSALSLVDGILTPTFLKQMNSIIHKGRMSVFSEPPQTFLGMKLYSR